MSAGIVNKLLIFFERLRCMENSARHVRRRAEEISIIECIYLTGMVI